MSSAIYDVVAQALNGLPMETRGRFLRDLMATAAAGLTALEGNAACAEAVYRLADAVVSDAPAQPPGAASD